jgi:multidrug efflux pump
MHALIDAAFSRSRTVAMVLVFLLALGAVSYVAIPKEASPDIPIPTIYVSTTLEGISPGDSERLLIEPLERELQSLEGLKELRADAAEGYAAITLEFEPGFDAEAALDDVRVAVDRARPELPDDASEPTVQEVNTSLFPVLTVILSGPLPERALIDLANAAKDRLERIEGVLEVDVGGDREELLEVLIDPTTLETYNISFEQLVSQMSRNNRLIAAGALDTGAGRIVLKVPGLIEDVQDVLEMPVKVEGSTVITFEDVAMARRTFREPEGFARIDGQPALSLEVKKRSGANIIETVDAVRGAITAMSRDWPQSLRVEYLQDESERVESLLGDLQNNVLAAIILVMIVIVATLGVRNSILVGLAIPGSFLTGVAILYGLGYTMNIVVLFSLILVVGMLVDGAIITVEYAERRMSDGEAPRAAFAEAARRMAWPIIASTATTLAVFLPLLFWSGTVGEFMKFLPITVLVTLSVSLVMALIFIPVLGGIIGKPNPQTPRQRARLRASETGDVMAVGGLTGLYLKALRASATRPSLTLALALWMLVGAFYAYGQFGRGVEFFPSIEPEFAQVQVRARDNLSIFERDALVRRVEARLLGMEEVESLYARTLGEGASRQLGEDVIGTIQLELIDWDRRRPASRILDDIRVRTADLAGIDVLVQQQAQGPTAAKPVQIELTGAPARLDQGIDLVRSLMDEVGGFVDVTDTRPIPGVEWQLEVDRAEAARYGADVTLLGQAVQLLTVGIPVAEYRPEEVDEPVDIRVRFPTSERTLERLEALRVPTSVGLVPIRNFVEFSPAPKTGTLKRIDGERVLMVEADVAEGLLVDDQVQALSAAVRRAELPAGVEVAFAGEAEEQQDAMVFLGGAFATAIFLMFTILVTQFNSFYRAALVLSAIVFSVAGVLLGLLVTGRPFGVVMGGIGVISLAGIVVNNNIILIDTYNDLRKAGQGPLEAVLRTGAQRLRPVLLTSVTTILGLVPMVLGANVDLLGRDVTFGAPSTQWWIDLSTAIAGGLAVATVLTLVLTPSMLMLGEQMGAWRARRRSSRSVPPVEAQPRSL